MGHQNKAPQRKKQTYGPPTHGAKKTYGSSTVGYPHKIPWLFFWPPQKAAQGPNGSRMSLLQEQAWLGQTSSKREKVGYMLEG